MNLIECQRCKEADESMFKKASGMVLQRKYDGSRTVMYIDALGRVKLVGKSQKEEYTAKYPEIVQEATSTIPHDTIIDGEITFFKGGKDVFQTVLATPETKAKYDLVAFMAFDIVRYHGKDVSKLPLQERISTLNAAICGSHHYIRNVATHGMCCDFASVYHHIVDNGGEGVVLKDAMSPYLFGKREAWYKVKQLHTEDCVVCGITKGTGVRAKTFGALILGQYKDGMLYHVGNCSGFTNAQLQSFYDRMMKMSSINHTFTVPDAKRYVIPTMVIEVKCLGRNNSMKLRQPRFVRERTDKGAKECEIL